MARVISNRLCAVCGKPNVQLWTLDNMEQVAAAHLCMDHAAPLRAIMNIAGPDEELPAYEPPVPTRGKREAKMEPLLDWTPPEPPPEPELTAEEKLVKQALKDGKTWPQISETLGIEVLDAVEKYGALWT